MDNAPDSGPLRIRAGVGRLLIAIVGVGLTLAAFDAVGPEPVQLKDGRIAGASSLVGPLLAVALVLLLRRPALGLFLAVVSGAIALKGPIGGLAYAATHVFWPTVSSVDNIMILVFTATMLGMVHVAIAGGGFSDLARRIASTTGAAADAPARRTRLSAWAMGLAIFFDDYANSLVVGSSIRPLADRTGVSRAKLAYLVDATSASVAGVAIVSTWVGFEVGLLQNSIASFAGIADAGYGVFVALIPYRFYCLFTIVFAFVIAVTGRDYGPMLRSERAAVVRPPVDESSVGRGHFLDAMGPVLVVLFTVLGVDTMLGWDKGGSILERFLAGADIAGLKVLAISGAAGATSAIAIAIGRRLLSPSAALRAFGFGIATTAPVLVILVCAMAMRTVCDGAGTPAYLAAMLGGVSGVWMPVTCFFVAALVAFMTGSSWATMGIMLPIVVPLGAADPGPGGIFLLGASAAVLDGAIFGDHCSPISDTTVMSSAASGCPHDEHVLTQLPYALTVMAAAAGFGYVGTAFLEVPAWTAWAPACVALTLFVIAIGRRPSETSSQN